MNKKLAVASALTFLLTFPLVSLALTFADMPGNLNVNIIYIIQQVLYVVWWVFIGLTVVSFVIAGVSFLTAQGDPGKLELARQFVIWGVAGVVVGVLAFSIVTIVRNTFVI